MRRHSMRACPLFALSLTLATHQYAAAEPQVVVVSADRMMDVISGQVIERPQITIRDGRISAIGRQGETVPAGAHRVELPGLTLLPGLIDMHVHLTADPRYSGYRGLEYTDNFWTVVAVADGAAAIRATVRKLRKYGAEVIKFCATGGVLSKTDTAGGQQYTLAEMQALVEEAHLLGLRVAVHAHGTSGIKDAIRAGADTIEHASLADEEAFGLAKQHGTWFSMDIYNDDYILAEGEKNGVFRESLEKERAIGLKQRQTFRAALKAGVKMVFGTDGGVYPNGTNALQFANMVEWGMTPLQAIQAATVNAAEALGRSADVGAIAVGRYGDLIAVAGDPLADVKLLRSIPFVMKGGEVVKAPAP